MLNTSIKVIATQYTDDHEWSQISEKKHQQFHQYQQNEHLLVTFNHLRYADVYSAGFR
jgi:hypothetical protein